MLDERAVRPQVPRLGSVRRVPAPTRVGLLPILGLPARAGVDAGAADAAHHEPAQQPLVLPSSARMLTARIEGPSCGVEGFSVDHRRNLEGLPNGRELAESSWISEQLGDVGLRPSFPSRRCDAFLIEDARDVDGRMAIDGHGEEPPIDGNLFLNELPPPGVAVVSAPEGGLSLRQAAVLGRAHLPAEGAVSNLASLHRSRRERAVEKRVGVL